ncbi:MAG TPA: ATP-dependent DNA helicase RecG [Frankiaceae bacterium]|nr:ATP-dependent DNA helicase RecG [Frankiaceae bacterium]
MLGEPLDRNVGGKTAEAMAELDLHTVGDLLDHIPRRYVERGELTSLDELVVGETVTIQAEVVRVSGRQIRHKLHKLDVVVSDGRGTLTVTFFNQHWRDKQLKPGTRHLFAGKVDVFGRNKVRQLTNPETNPDDDDDDFAGGLLPLYPATAKLRTWHIRKAVKSLLASLPELPDPLPLELRQKYKLPGLREAYQKIHRPTGFADVEAARKRLRWDEALVIQVALAQRRAAVERQSAVPRPERPGGLLEAFDRALPFDLTGGQHVVGEEVAHDLARTFPMHRLLQGEVGSGKTVVALRAMLTVIDAGGQSALLAPTEVLAVQHERSLRALLGPLGIAGELGSADEATRIVLLTGSQTAGARRAALAAIAEPETGIVVGTHALLSEGVDFAELGLAVVDEQHRFGVEQRDALRARAEASGGTPPHLLVMTATPIPRTVAMTVFGDLDTSELTELPAGRTPIRSHVAAPQWHNRIWLKVREEVAAGHQAFVVCPRIGEGPEVDVDIADEPAADPTDPTDEGADSGERRPPLAVLEVLPLLAEGELQGLRIEALHGRLPSEEKERVMSRFTAGQIDVLVATTMVEVGVDVPNATVMVILDADRFGVSQLHQLRGRVGRGSAEGWCLLHTEAPEASPSRERVEAVAATLDGAELAKLDLRERREGDVLGTAQSGRRRSLKLLDLLRDEQLLIAARAEAAEIVAHDPDLEQHGELARVLARRLDEERAAYLEKG